MAARVAHRNRLVVHKVIITVQWDRRFHERPNINKQIVYLLHKNKSAKLIANLRKVIHVTTGLDIFQFLQVFPTTLLLVDAPHMIGLHLSQFFFVEFRLPIIISQQLFQIQTYNCQDVFMTNLLLPSLLEIADRTAVMNRHLRFGESVRRAYCVKN